MMGSMMSAQASDGHALLHERIEARVRAECYEEIGRLKDEIARLKATQEWQPIETAPKDGTYILVATVHGAWIAQYKAVFQSGFAPDNPWCSVMLNHDHVERRYRTWRPSHWMKLPQPPETEK